MPIFFPPIYIYKRSTRGTEIDSIIIRLLRNIGQHPLPLYANAAEDISRIDIYSHFNL